MHTNTLMLVSAQCGVKHLKLWKCHQSWNVLGQTLG